MGRKLKSAITFFGFISLVASILDAFSLYLKNNPILVECSKEISKVHIV